MGGTMSLFVNVVAAVVVLAAFILWGPLAAVIALLAGGIIAIRVANIERRAR